MLNSISSGDCGCGSMMLAGRTGNSGSTNRIADDLFSKMDANSDGIVDKLELSDTLKSMSAAGTAMPDADTLFSRLDANGDGKITAGENSDGVKLLIQEYGHLQKGGGRHHRHRPDNMFANADALFKQFDSNGDGSISRDEYLAGMDALHHPAQDGPPAGGASAPADSAMQAFVAALLQSYQNTDAGSNQASTGSTVSVAV